MKKILIGIIAILAVIGIATLALRAPKQEMSASGKPTIKIGVIAPFTGNITEFGKNTRAAIEVAREDFKPQNVDFEFIYEDYAFSTAKASLAANKLITLDKVDAIISWSSMAGNAIAPITDKNKIIHFSISNGKNVAEGKYNFINFSSSEAMLDKLYQIVDKYQPKKVGIFVAYHPSLQQTANILEAELKAKGISVGRENFALDHRDFNMMVDSAKAQKYDLVYIETSNPTLDLLLKSFYEKQINVPITAINAFDLTKELPVLEGSLYVSTSDGRPDVLERVTQKTGSENYFSVGYTYDSAKLLMETYDKVGKNSDDVAEALLKVKDYDATVGKISVDDKGIFHSEAVIKKIENGKRVQVQDVK